MNTANIFVVIPIFKGKGQEGEIKMGRAEREGLEKREGGLKRRKR